MNEQYIKSFEEKEKQQQQATPFAAAVFSCLKDLDIPESDKLEISRTYSLKEVEHAVKFATNPCTKIKTTLQQCIKWACKNKPDLPTSKEETIMQNRNNSQILEKACKEVNGVKIEASATEVLFIYTNAQRKPETVGYDDARFKEKVLHLLIKLGFKK